MKGHNVLPVTVWKREAARGDFKVRWLSLYDTIRF